MIRVQVIYTAVIDRCGQVGMQDSYSCCRQVWTGRDARLIYTATVDRCGHQHVRTQLL